MRIVRKGSHVFMEMCHHNPLAAFNTMADISSDRTFLLEHVNWVGVVCNAKTGRLE